jgi:hypothetical protein
MEKNRGDEPIQVIIQIYMETHSEISGRAILNKQKMSFSSPKTENRKTKQVLSGRLLPVGGRRI